MENAIPVAFAILNRRLPFQPLIFAASQASARVKERRANIGAHVLHAGEKTTLRVRERDHRCFLALNWMALGLPEIMFLQHYIIVDQRPAEEAPMTKGGSL